MSPALASGNVTPGPAGASHCDRGSTLQRPIQRRRNPRMRCNTSPRAGSFFFSLWERHCDMTGDQPKAKLAASENGPHPLFHPPFPHLCARLNNSANIILQPRLFCGNVRFVSRNAASTLGPHRRSLCVDVTNRFSHTDRLAI